jgi:hypothetical protein
LVTAFLIGRHDSVDQPAGKFATLFATLPAAIKTRRFSIRLLR